MQTLTQSGALWQLHAWKNSFALAARFQAQRLKQVRRAIRRHRIVLFRLRLRRLLPNWSLITGHWSPSSNG